HPGFQVPIVVTLSSSGVDGQQHDMLVRVLTELEPPDRGRFQCAHAMVARNAYVAFAVHKGSAIGTVKRRRNRSARWRSIRGVEHPDNGVCPGPIRAAGTWRSFRTTTGAAISSTGCALW